MDAGAKRLTLKHEDDGEMGNLWTDFVVYGADVIREGQKVKFLEYTCVCVRVHACMNACTCVCHLCAWCVCVLSFVHFVRMRESVVGSLTIFTVAMCRKNGGTEGLRCCSHKYLHVNCNLQGSVTPVHV